MIEMTIDMG